jgi:SpoVK/Ycf46/Vps4 family AAA+-type ATPase
MIVRLDAVISSYLGETASNLKAIFEAVERTPCVLFFDEFDALARTRTDANEHNEIRRVVNSLLMMIERFTGRGFIIAATNLEASLDQALWRRFDEVIYFEPPTVARIRTMLRLKTKNFTASFDIEARAEDLTGYSYAEIEAIILSSIKMAIINRRKRINEVDFNKALKNQIRRSKLQKKMNAK